MPLRDATATIREAIRLALRTHHLESTGKPLVVAVSGGADSLALLWELAQLREPLGLRLHVAHLDHALRP